MRFQQRDPDRLELLLSGGLGGGSGLIGAAVGAGRRAGAVGQAPAPARLIEGGLPTETLVVHVLVGKYADHLPLYRQSQIYTRQGIELDRSTLADWVGRAAAELRPLYERRSNTSKIVRHLITGAQFAGATAVAFAFWTSTKPRVLF